MANNSKSSNSTPASSTPGGSTLSNDPSDSASLQSSDKHNAIELIDSLIASPGSLAIGKKAHSHDLSNSAGNAQSAQSAKNKSEVDESTHQDHIEHLFARNKSIRTYLYLLGYLSSDNSSPYLTHPLKRAIRHFQQDADLLPDQWVGEKTWRALQTLVSFEAGDRIDLWVDKDKRQTALHRAINLRLHVLGFLDKSKFASEASTNQALEAFYQHALLVGQISAFRQNAQTGWLRHKKLISALFDAQGMLVSTSRYQVAHKTTLPVSVNLAKIELFLLGYDVQPTRSRSYKISTADINRFAFFRRNPASVSPAKANQYKLYDAMQSFLQSQGSSRVSGATSSRKITYKFIAELAKLHQQVTLNKTQQAQQVFQHISQASDAQTQNKIWEHIKSIGGRIFDGVNRVIKWVASVIKTNLQNTVEAIKNIARLTHMLASDGLQVMVDSAKQIKRGVRFLKRNPIQGSDNKDWYVTRTQNSDYVVLINAQANKQVLNAKTKHFKAQIADFKLAMVKVRKAIRGVKLAIALLKVGTGVGFISVLGLVGVFM